MSEYKYSTFWPRFGAGFVDGLVFLPISWIYNITFSACESVVLKIVLCTVHSSAYLLYSIWMHSKYGQTVGKMVFNVIVRDVSEQPLSMKQAVLRDIFGVILVPISLLKDIGRIVEGIDISSPENLTAFDWFVAYSALGWFVIEVVTMLTNRKRRSLHDFIAGSVVIRE